MSVLIGQILHCREARGWTVSNHEHTNISKEKVKSLSLIKYLTLENRDTPLFFFFKEVNLMICEKNNWLKMCLFYFLPLFCRVCMIWIKKTMYMPLWLKTTIATQVCAQEALTHLYVDAIKEYHAWYATNWKNLHEM